MIKHFFSIYLSCLGCMLFLDALWISSTINILYKKNIGHLMTTKPVYPAALLFYFLYALGITVFILLPGLERNKNFIELFMYGALFGLIAYGTYDLTNHATMQNWPVCLTIIDMTWGAFVTGITSSFSIYLLRLLGYL